MGAGLKICWAEAVLYSAEKAIPLSCTVYYCAYFLCNYYPEFKLREFSQQTLIYLPGILYFRNGIHKMLEQWF